MMAKASYKKVSTFQTIAFIATLVLMAMILLGRIFGKILLMDRLLELKTHIQFFIGLK